ncbi:hypothetical protein Efla_003157 [Eimeria flavescens]
MADPTLPPSSQAKLVPKAKQKPPKLLLSSDSSSSDESSLTESGRAKEQLAPSGRPSGNVLRQSSVLKDTHVGPKQSLASADPLLSVDFQPAAPQRIKSAVVARKPSKSTGTTQPHSASMEIRSKGYQLLSRSASRAGAAKSAVSDAPQEPSEKEPARSKAKGAVPEKTKPQEPPKAKEKSSAAPVDDAVKSVPPERANTSAQKVAPAPSRELTSDDAWTLAKGEDTGKMQKREASRIPAQGGPGQAPAADRKASSVVSNGAKDPKMFAKQGPRLPIKRVGNTDAEDVPLRSDSSRSGGSQKLTTQKSSSGAPAQSTSAPKAPAGQGRAGGPEDRGAIDSKRVAELEAHLKEITARHKEELERERLSNRALGEEIRKLRSERDAVIERARKEADAAIAAQAKENEAKIDEVRKEALAHQNKVKMQCETSVRELKERVESLEKQLKAKTEEFEKEKRSLKKSFEDQRKTDQEIQERKAQAHQEELKSKDAELLEQQGRVQALTTSVQTLTTSLAQMKKLNDISRTATEALEEKSKSQAAYIKTLTKRDEALRSQATRMMPIKEAKRLAFRALLKGRAVEMISRACTSTDAGLWNKAWAFQQFVDLIGGGRSSHDQRRDTIESRLMQFRKEQMFLMAENERLMAKVAQLQQEGVNQKQSKAALLEQALLVNNPAVVSSATHDDKIMVRQDPRVRWLVASVQQAVNKKVLWAFLRLQKVTTESESNVTIDTLQKKFNELRVSAYKEMAARIGSCRITSYIRVLRQRLLFSALFAFSRNAGRHAVGEALKQAKEGAISRDPFSKESAALDVPFAPNYSSLNDGELDLNAPLAHQPYYYRQLPSVRNPARGRNLFVPVIQPSPPVQGYLPHPGYSNPHLTVGVPPAVSRGRRVGTSPGVPNVFPSGPYDATQPVDERGAIYRIRGTQQDLRRVMMEDVNDRGGTRIVGKKYVTSEA